MAKPYSKLIGILAERGIRNRDIADLLNISEQSVSNKLNRRNGLDFRADEIKKISETYEIDSNIIFFGVSDPFTGQEDCN